MWSREWTESGGEVSRGLDKTSENEKTNDRLKRIAYAEAKKRGFNSLPDNDVVNILRKDSEEWINKLTPEEKRAIIKYIYNGKDLDGKRLYEKINGYLEARYTPDSLNEEKTILKNAANTQKGLLKNKLEYDIIVYRKDKYVNSLKEKVIKFLSTSVTTKGAFQGKPNIAIIVPKGSKGAYVEKLSEKLKQREFIFEQGVSLRKIHNQDNLEIYAVI